MNQAVWAVCLGTLWAVCLIGCGEEDPTREVPWFGGPSTTPTRPPTPTTQDPEAEPLPVATDICVLGDVRCTTPFVSSMEICRIPEDATVPAARWVPELCPGDRVCIDGRCQSMQCEPGRATCDGFDAVGVCNASGDGLEEVQPCPDDTLCRGGACADSCASLVSSRSYIGCEYKVVELATYRDNYVKAPFGLIVANIDPLHETTVTVVDAHGEPAALLNDEEVEAGEIPDIASQSFVENPWLGKIPVEQSRAQEIVIPRQGTATLLFASNPIRYGSVSITEQSRTLRASRPVVAYQMNPYCCFDSHSNDATILFPVSALGTTYTVPVAPDWPLPAEAHATFGAALGGGVSVVATQDDTTVRVELPSEARLQDARGGEDRIPEEGGSFGVVLQDGEVLYLESKSSVRTPSTLNGTRVESNAPVAVFSSHPCSRVPFDFPACDHLESQVASEDTLGKHFVLSALARRSDSANEVVYWHVQAPRSQGATITVRGDLAEVEERGSFARTIPSCSSKGGDSGAHIALGAGEGCILGTRRSVEIRSNAALMVFGYITSQDTVSGASSNDAAGDPSLFLLPPVEQFRDTYEFLIPFTYAYDYVTLIISRDAIPSLTLDGLPVDARGEGVTWQDVEGTRFVTLNLPVEDGAHRILAEGHFGLIVYGYDRYVSFAYPGGMNLTKRPR